MARTYSLADRLGMKAPAFDLPIANPWIDAEPSATRSLANYAEADVLVAMFICNHCPYVVHVQDELVRLANDYAETVQFVAISSNDTETYPADSFERMAERAKTKIYPFPYLYDETQAVAKAYGATCTPDLFVFDTDRTLVYHGRLDETRPAGTPAHGRELRHALDQILDTGTAPTVQHPSMGCNIKWKPGNEPSY